MFFWFIGTAVVAVWFVFHDPRFDYRLLVAGALVADVIDAPFGGARVMHSVTGSVAVLFLVMAVTAGRKPIRRRLLAIPIGTFLHLVFDGAFSNTKAFWWPFGGVGFGDAPLPSWDRGAVNIPLELLGLAACVWAFRKFGLRDPERRRTLWRKGTLEPC
jgi:hypothetical protein